MQPVLGRALGRPVCRRRPVDGYRQNPPSWNAKTRPEDGKTALCINLWSLAALNTECYCLPRGHIVTCLLSLANGSVPLKLFFIHTACCHQIIVLHLDCLQSTNFITTVNFQFLAPELSDLIKQEKITMK